MSYASEINSRKLINGVDDVVKLYPIKYKFAWDYYNTGNANHWTPQEVDMQSDLSDWRKLTPSEQHIIKTALGFFTTADSLVANNLVLGVYRRLTAPECRMYLLRQAFDEAIHTEAYQHIVTTLGLDEEEIFNKYKTIQSIYNKDQFVTNLANNLHNDSTDQEFLESLIDFYIIMEGVFFYTSFASIFNFKRKNLLSGTVEQFQYILRDESMHLNFGIELINGIKSENPHLWTQDFTQKIVEKIYQACALETQYAAELIGNGMFGISLSSFIQYSKYITDRRLQSIGLPTLYSIENPFPWMSGVADLPKSKNFFETTVIDYSTGTLEWS